MRPLFLLLVSLPCISFSQSITQILRGSVVDKQIQQTLIGANVVVMNTQPLMGSTTDEKGSFRIDHVPVGTYNIQVTYIGYEPKIFPNIEINSGKETVITVELEEMV